MKRIEYLIWSALCLILVSCEAPVVDDFGVRLPEEPLAVNGCVVDTDGAPMEGVVVSDGYTVTQTDAEGRYEITAPRCAAFVWVSAPEGYMAPLKESGIPDFSGRSVRSKRRRRAVSRLRNWMVRNRG